MITEVALQVARRRSRRRYEGGLQEVRSGAEALRRWSRRRRATSRGVHDEETRASMRLTAAGLETWIGRGTCGARRLSTTVRGDPRFGSAREKRSRAGAPWTGCPREAPRAESAGQARRHVERQRYATPDLRDDMLATAAASRPWRRSWRPGGPGALHGALADACARSGVADGLLSRRTSTKSGTSLHQDVHRQRAARPEIQTTARRPRARLTPIVANGGTITDTMRRPHARRLAPGQSASRHRASPW